MCGNGTVAVSPSLSLSIGAEFSVFFAHLIRWRMNFSGGKTLHREAEDGGWELTVVAEKRFTRVDSGRAFQ